MRTIIISLSVAALCASPVLAQPPTASGKEDLTAFDLMTGGRKRGPALQAAVDKAAAFPLGSRDNPVRVDMPQGQRAYLGQLRCTNGRAPAFSRSGSLGPGVFGSIVDAYHVVCPDGGEPRESTIIMDMYHPGHVETGAPPGFTLVD